MAVAAGFGSAVAFGAKSLRGAPWRVALHFSFFVFLWVLLPTFVVGSAWLILRLRSRTKSAGVTLDYLAGLDRQARVEFQKRHRI